MCTLVMWRQVHHPNAATARCSRGIFAPSRCGEHGASTPPCGRRCQAADGYTTMGPKEFKTVMVKEDSAVAIWVDEEGEWDAANKKGAWVRGTCVSRVGETKTQWVVKDTTGKVHRPTFKFNKGKHAGTGKMFCFLVKSDACQCIDDDSEDDG